MIHLREGSVEQLADFDFTARKVTNSSPYWTRSAFLEKLKTPKTGKYKRYTPLPLRYAGGKSLAVGHILEHFPDNLKHMASPFFGGGAVEIACARELGVQVQGYDVFNMLVNFWHCILANPNKLAKVLEGFEPTKEQYRSIKSELKGQWESKRKLTNSIGWAARYWFNHNLSYGPGFLGWMSSIYECPQKYERALAKVREFECDPLSVANGSFEDTIPKHNGEFLYCDPPYYLDDGKMFKGIYPQRNFPVHHNGFNHLLLSQLLKQHKGGFVLSYNDCQTIRDLYSDYKIVDVGWQYTMGQGETRIGRNRVESNASHVKQSHEILVVSDG